MKGRTVTSELLEGIQFETMSEVVSDQVHLGSHRNFIRVVDWATYERSTVYAIAFDLDTAALNRNYPGNSPNNGYAEIATYLGRNGFTRQQGSVYFGDESVTPVNTVLVVQQMARDLPWFASSVRDIRMLRIEENNDLNPAITAQALGLTVDA